MSPPVQLQRVPRRKKSVPKRALLFLALLLIVLCTGLAGCSAQAADAPITTAAADLKRAQAGAWLSLKCSNAPDNYASTVGAWRCG